MAVCSGIDRCKAIQYSDLENLKEMGISYSMLCDSGVRKVWLIYREEEILEILGKKEYSEFLDTFGYRGFEFPQMLQIMNEDSSGGENP